MTSSLSPGELIRSPEVINLFLSNIRSAVLAPNTYYDTSNMPYFSGSVGTNKHITQANKEYTISNPQALPYNDLDSYVSAYNEGTKINIGNTGDVISASKVYNSLLNATIKLTRVRKFQSTWYHQEGTTNIKQDVVRGRAIFKESLSSVSSSWKRNKNTAIQNITNVSTAGDNPLNMFIGNLFDAWNTATETEIIYEYYSCHFNCHSSCHGNSRSRR